MSLSLVAHGFALGGLLIAAAWRVDKLEGVDTPVVIAAGFVPLPSVSEGPPRPKPTRSDRPPRPAKKITQPGDKIAPAAVPASDETIGDEDETGGGPGAPCPPGRDCAPTGAPPVAQPMCGDGRVDAGEECDDGGTDAGDGCSAICRREAPAVVRANVIEGHRIAGDPQIAAPESVRSQMMRKNQERVSGMVKMCLGADGAVRSLRLLESTGYPAYDERLIAGMQGWRYEPYLVAGKPMPVCTVVTFIYRMR